jgi:retron-type reverse transcriptase
MKTFKHLFAKIVTFENLLIAAKEAAKGKQEKSNVMQFFAKLEDNLYRLQYELETQCYRPGNYSTFNIYEPKPRMISAAPFRDRVVHHALMNVIGPLLERSFIFDSYANRPGKGTHRAIRRYQQFLKQYEFVLKCDIKSYFPSIDHETLKSLIRKRIGCHKTLWLIDTIIDNSNPQKPKWDYFPGDTLFTPVERRVGLPIGNLTSQFFANYYLNPFDHFIKETLRCKAYVRYVDDFVLFHDSKSQLWDWKEQVVVFLQDYRLKLQAKRCHVYPARVGNRFLGQVVFRTHRRLASANVRTFKKRMRNWQKHPPANLQQRIAGWVGHAKQANTFSLLVSLGLEYF